MTREKDRKNHDFLKHFLESCLYWGLKFLRVKEERIKRLKIRLQKIFLRVKKLFFLLKLVRKERNKNNSWPFSNSTYLKWVILGDWNFERELTVCRSWTSYPPWKQRKKRFSKIWFIKKVPFKRSQELFGLFFSPVPIWWKNQILSP